MTLFKFSQLVHLGASVGISTRFAPTIAVRASHIAFMSTGSRGLTTKQTPSARSYLALFFAQYPKFKYDQKEPFMDEFWRLVDTYQFGRRSKQYKSARKGVKEAILLQFKDIYETHSVDTHVWHRFFSAIGIQELPQNIGLCHKLAKSIHLNICDLIDRPVTGIDIQTFPSELELRRYTFKDAGKPMIVPPIPKKSDPILGRLFRRITNPPRPKVENVLSIPSSFVKFGGTEGEAPSSPS
ncbi:hypothetical protein RSOLAG22IIIB_12939 [Rhizoctonia solani]|uniref:Uncharacterized protein n=1 Tax=Rhizoctonia solani TaxID=456999 RepID=A0A0K6GHQ2_9AGAM|nr:hypothetical protein RSOLAG22IIIB_12939 [Rhizoctonia solani]